MTAETTGTPAGWREDRMRHRQIWGAFKVAANALARRGAGLRGKYEAGFLFLVLMIIEWIIPGAASLAQIAPHPFWVPVILLSVQYGSRTGLVVAAVATGLSWLAGWLPQTSQEDFYTYSLRVCREPALWIGAALIIGGLRNRQIDERLALEERLLITERQRDTIAGFCSELQEGLTIQERRAATAWVGSIEAGLLSLERLRAARETAQMLALLQAAVVEWLGRASWTLYPLSGSELRPAHTSEDSPGTTQAAALVRTAMIYAVACHRPRVLSIFDEADAALLDGVGVFACPVRPIEGGPYYGLLVVETVPVDRLVPSTARAVLAIASALGEAFDEANWSAALEDTSLPTPNGACGPRPFDSTAGEVPCNL